MTCLVVLPRDQRLVEPSGFTSAVRRGRRAGGRLLVVHALASGEPGLRAGFIVSKAVGPAVVRNRVKRRLRELVRERIPDLSGWLLVVRALPGARDASYLELRDELARCLNRALAGDRPAQEHPSMQGRSPA